MAVVQGVEGSFGFQFDSHVLPFLRDYAGDSLVSVVPVGAQGGIHHLAVQGDPGMGDGHGHFEGVHYEALGVPDFDVWACPPVEGQGGFLGVLEAVLGAVRAPLDGVEEVGLFGGEWLGLEYLPVGQYVAVHRGVAGFEAGERGQEISEGRVWVQGRLLSLVGWIWDSRARLRMR